MHLFTPNFTLYSVLLETKTNFPLSHKKYKKNLYKTSILIVLEQLEVFPPLCFMFNMCLFQ